MTRVKLIHVYTLIAMFVFAALAQAPSSFAAVSRSVARITTSTDMACGITSAGALYCWGQNFNGQIGDGTNISKSLPTLIPVPGGGRWSGNVEGADGHTCATTTDGRLFCWGEGRQGRLGNGTEDNQYFPTIVTVPDGSRWKQVDVSDASTCALSTQGNLYCWGYLYGILNNGDYNEPSWFMTPQQVNLAGLSIDTFVYGNPDICALSNGKLYCWGEIVNSVTGETQHFEPPTLWGDPTKTWKVFNSQGSSWCGIDWTDDLYCWGWSYSSYELPCSEGEFIEDWEVCLDTEFIAASVPRLIEVDDAKWRDVSTRNGNVCAITVTDRLYCWGQNVSGQIGIGTESIAVNNPSFVNSPGGVRWAYVEIGDARSCGVTNSGEFYCWGMDHDPFWEERGCTPDPATAPEWCAGAPWGALGNGAIFQQVSTPVRADPPQSTLDPDTLAPTAPGVAPLGVVTSTRNSVPSSIGITAVRYRGFTYTVPTTKFFAILKPTAPKYQWYRCPTSAAEASDTVDGLGCTLITRATGSRYKSTRADQGTYLRVRITSTNGRGAGAYTTTIFTPSTALVP